MQEKLLIILKKGLNALNIKLDQKAQSQLVDYVLLLEKWNKTQNLTSVSCPEEMMIRHVLDSLGIVEAIAEDLILDVGSGAGLPGIPIAVYCPNKTIHLLECRLKRVVFLKRCVSQLELANVRVVHTRLEDYRPEQPYPAIVARAFCQPHEYFNKVDAVLAPQGNAYLQLGQNAVIPEHQGTVVALPAGGSIWIQQK